MVFWNIATVKTQTQKQSRGSICACQLRWGPQSWVWPPTVSKKGCLGFTNSDSKTERACLQMMGVAFRWPTRDLSLWVSCCCHCHHSWRRHRPRDYGSMRNTAETQSAETLQLISPHKGKVSATLPGVLGHCTFPESCHQDSNTVY